MLMSKSELEDAKRTQRQAKASLDLSYALEKIGNDNGLDAIDVMQILQRLQTETINRLTSVKFRKRKS